MIKKGDNNTLDFWEMPECLNNLKIKIVKLHKKLKEKRRRYNRKQNEKKFLTHYPSSTMVAKKDIQILKMEKRGNKYVILCTFNNKDDEIEIYSNTIQQDAVSVYWSFRTQMLE